MNFTPMNEKYYINLIHKQLSQEASADESAELKAWLDESSDHQDRYEEERRLWELSAQPIDPEQLEVNLDAEFAALQARIKADEGAASEEQGKVISLAEEPPKKTGSWNFMRIAAALVLFVGLGYVVQQFLGGNADMVRYAAVDKAQLIELPDQSTVRLNKGASLAYAKDFSGAIRKIELEGEAYFKVAKDAERPFIIETAAERIRVVGTEFNVFAPADAAESEVYVVEGIVEFGALEGEAIRLVAKDLGTLNRAQGSVQKEEGQNANAIAWFSQELNFTDVPLEEVLYRLENLYQVSIEANPILLKTCRFTGNFKNQDLATALEVLATVFDVEVEDRGAEGYLLKGEACE